MGHAERSAALAQIARSWLERERDERLAAATRAQKRVKARCLAAAREHLSRAERTGDPGDPEPPRHPLLSVELAPEPAELRLLRPAVVDLVVAAAPAYRALVAERPTSPEPEAALAARVDLGVALDAAREAALLRPVHPDLRLAPRPRAAAPRPAPRRRPRDDLAP
jgi:hypothetical protein